jgi:DNA anti-recombination protein RmuC
MPTDLLIAVLAACVGAVAGAAIAARRRPPEDETEALQALNAQLHAELTARLEVHAAELRRIADATGQRDRVTDHLREGLDSTRQILELIQARDEERRSSETENREVVRRLATVLAGGNTKGRAGEHVLREHLGQLPPSMLASDFRVNGKVVEFGLRLPDGRRLPIDSKWAALAELEAMEAEQDPTRRAELARKVEKAVAARAKDVGQYLDPAVTAPVAVAAVPDAAYQVLSRAHAVAFSKSVVIVPYSTALPVILFLYALVERYGEAADVQAALAEVGTLLDAMDSIVENRFARAGTMIANGADEFRSHLGKARGSIARARHNEQLELPDADQLELSDAGTDESILSVIG